MNNKMKGVAVSLVAAGLAISQAASADLALVNPTEELAFGTITYPGTATLALRMRNTSTTDTIDNVTVSNQGGKPGVFSYSLCPQQLFPQQECEIYITFSAQDNNGRSKTTLSVSGNVGDNDVAVPPVTLIGHSSR